MDPVFCRIKWTFHLGKPRNRVGNEGARVAELEKKKNGFYPSVWKFSAVYSPKSHHIPLPTSLGALVKRAKGCRKIL